MRRWLLIPIFIISAASAVPSTVSLYSISITLKDDTLYKTIEIRGIQGSDRLLSRIAHGFNPEIQSIELGEAIFGYPGMESGHVPEWAVDTLSGSGGWPRSHVVAFPALREGMEISYRILIKDWSESWSEGPWAVLAPSVRGISPDSCCFRFQSDIPDDPAWSGQGYTERVIDDGFMYTCSDSAGKLWITTFQSFEDLYAYILFPVNEILRRSHPLDLREAALQTTSAGADEWSQVRRARSLVCNSMGLRVSEMGIFDFEIRSLQEILDSRDGTPIELAAIFTAMCHELGLQAYILPATELHPLQPVPQGWTRYLVRIETDDGRSWLVEPSAYLTPAFFIFKPDTLYVLDKGILLTHAPNSGAENSLIEEWNIDPKTGTFRLSMNCRGRFDMLLRRKFAGLTEEEMILVLSEWSWKSGRPVVPDSISITDPFDLAQPASLFASGIWSAPAENSEYCDILPKLSWGGTQIVSVNLKRIWNLEGCASAQSDSTLIPVKTEDTVTFIDTTGILHRLPVLIEIEQ
ncbi:MAG: hypothetical protein KAW14_00970 [Candidatus Aegiribacteria sp.]|nr:hypothetical protein [Candidatus Aegiribacteria sp.]